MYNYEYAVVLMFGDMKTHTYYAVVFLYGRLLHRKHAAGLVSPKSYFYKKIRYWLSFAGVRFHTVQIKKYAVVFLYGRLLHRKHAAGLVPPK